MADNQFIVELQAKLDEAKSKNNINSDIGEIQKQLDKLKLKAELDPKSISNITKQLEGILNQKIDISNINFDTKTGQQVGNTIAKNITEGISKSGSEINDEIKKVTERINKIQLLSNGGIKNDYSTQLAKLEGQYRSLGLTEDEVKTKTSNVLKTLDTLKAKVNQPFDENNYQEIISLNDKLQKELAESSNEYTKLQSSAKGYVSVHQRLTKANTIEAWNQKNSNATKDAISNNEAYMTSLRNLNVQMTKMEFEQISRGFKENENSMRGMNRLGASLTNQFKETTQGIGRMFSIGSGVMLLVNKLWKIPQEVIKVNSAMVELDKVSNASASDIRDYFDEAAESAKRYGSSVSDMINATADWSRLGYNLPDAKQLAEVATLYTNVGDGINIDTANQSLISTLQGFQLEAEDAMNIIDKFNEVANSFPIDSAGIGEALQRSAASFHAANTDLSKSIALITGTNSVVQDPSRVGNMWKTVSMRIRGTKQELEAAGEDTDGMVESTAQLRDLVKGLTGFDIMADAAGTQFKDIYDIVVGIGKEWKKLTDVEQAGLLETLAGKTQGNALSAALSNVSMIEEAYKTAENSAGSALKEQEAYEQGIEYSLARLEASFQSFANHVLDSGFLKGIVDFGNGIITVLDAVTSKLGSLGTIGAGAGLFAGIKNVGKPKMFGFCFEYADNNICSLGY